MFLVHYIFLLSLFLLTQNQAYAAAIACNAVTEVSQTFSFSGTNTWPSGSTTRNYTIGTAPNDVTLTFTNTQVVTPMTGDPTQRTHGNIANTVTVSSNGGYAANTLLSTFALSTSRAINKLSFTITDEDANTTSGYNFRDRTISTTNAGVTTAITADVGANQTIVVGSGQATATNSADCDETDNNCNIYLEFNRTGITTASTEFRAAHTGTSTAQRIGFNQYAWCLPRMPTVKVQKITTGHTGAGGTFTFADTNLTGTIASISTTAPSTATPASPTALPATTINTDVTITETPASGFALSSATCSDANSGSTGNPASFGSLAGNVLTIPATNMRAGADITCTFTNTKRPTLTLRKISNGGTGSFGFALTNTVQTTGTITTSTAGATEQVDGDTGTAGTQAYTVSATGVDLTINENSLPSGWSLLGATCTNSGGTTVGSLAGSTYTIPAASVTAGQDYTCTFTNNKLPTITLTKVSVDNNGIFSFSGTNGFGSDSIATSTSGVGVTGTTKTLTSAAFTTSTVITETIPSNYTLTNIACSGLGSGGTATNNLSAGTVTLNTAATAAGANISCTFTNTASSSSGGSFPSQIACNAAEIGQTFEFNATNTWPSGTTSKSFTVGTAPNDVTLTFTHTQAAGVTPISGDPSLRTYGNVANSLTISSNGGLASNTLIATLGLTPSRAINKLSYSIYDSDYYNSGGFNFRDRTVSTSSAGNPTTITAQNATNETISGNTTTATTSADCGANDANCNLYFAYNLNGITSASTQFYAAHASGTSTQQAIAFSRYAWCLPRMPTVKVQKITTGHTGAGGTFTFADTNLTGTIASISTTAPSTATPASPTALPATTINTDVTITETPASGFALSSATCSDANSGSTGNPASFGSLAGNVLTIPATNMRAGADITCTFTNTKRPTLTLRKISNGGTGTFGFALTNTVQTTGTITTSTAGATEQVDGDTGTAGTQAYTISATGVDLTINENSLPSGWSLLGATCTNSGGTTVGSLAGSTYTIPAGSVTAGQDYTCTFTNNKLPTITLTKVSVDNNGIFSFSGTNGFGSDSITTSTSGVGVTGTTKTLTSAAFTTSTVITETIPSNYTLTNIACSGLGSGGTATNNLSAGTVTLNTAATAAGANISCTFTNTASSSSGGSFPSQIACNAAEIGQTFEFNATNTWPSGTSSKSFVVGTAPNNVTVTFTNTQAVTAMSGDPSLRTYGNVANSLTISSNGGLASNTLIATLGLAPSRAINKLSYSIYDSDYYNSGGFNFRDRTISTSSAGNPTTITAQNGTNETISGNTTTATTSADCGANDANCNLYFAYNLNGITSASTQFYAAHASGTSTQQLIAFNQYAWCLPKHPTVTISKTTNGGTGSFSFTNTNLASASTNLTTATAGTAVSSTAMNVTSLASNVQIQETVPSGWQLASASCTDANGALTTNGTGTFGSLAGSTLTIPSANLVYGADIRCSFTNQKVVPLTLRKTWVNAITNDAVNVTSSGGTVNPSLSSVANTANETDTATVANVYVADTLTFSEGFTTGNSANYNSALSCTGATDTNLADGLTINTADSAITCTYTNTRKTATFRLAKAWGANSISGNVANLGATTGLTNNTTAFTSTASTNTTETSITVYAGETVTLPAETMSTGTLSNYNTVLSCTADAGATANTLSGTNGQVSNTLLIGAGDEGKAIVCTYTNTRIAQNLTLVKQWTNAATGHTATVTTTGGTNNSTFNATAPSTGLTGTTVTVYAGDVVTLPVETFGGGASVSDYNSTVACTGGSTLVSGAVGRSVTISNSTTATTCTYSNTGLSDMVPTLTYMPNTGIVGSPYYGKFTCTNNGIAPATAGATCAISLPAGLSATCSPTVPTASTVAVGASINCTVTGTPTTSGSGTLVLTTGATNDSNGGTTTGGNNQVSQAITIVDSTTAPTCSPGSTTNLLSSAGTELYFSDNTATPITNNFGLIASPATYVRTGSNFVVKGDWRWRNANPAAGSPAMTYQLIVNGTVYAQLVGTPSGQEVGTLTALNGATLDGGLSTMQLYDFSVSGLAALPVGVTLPSTVTSISTLSMSFVSSTTPADDAGLAPTVLNACALPKLTLSKVSQGGVGAFAFTGNNGFSNETITTTVAGTGVAGTTQTLSAVSTPTTITETIPSGYTVTDISCTGLGSGNATPNLVTGSVVISDSALVYGANIACTYTNTKLPTITISKISQGGTGTFSFTGTNGFASQNITTSSAGVAVAGATQTLSAAATATTITETIPSGYTVTDISCTGLGAGSATPNLVGGSISLNAAATAAGANIACTYTNTKLPTISISKISQGGTGTFSFTGTNGFAAQNITTSSVGVAVAGATQTLSAAATATTITETIPSGYTVTDISCTGLGAGSATPNLVGGSVSLDAAATAAGANIACTFTNTASAFTITGKVFLDNGKNSATPHNGIQEVDEQGIGNALVRLTNCSSTVYQTTVTDGSGGYTLSIPNSLSAGTTLCVEEYQQPANLVSVSANVGTTGGSYTLTIDKVQFTLAASTNYTGVNFGDVVQSQLTGTGNQTIPAGTTASYGHQFIAGTEGSVTFSTAQAPTPLLAWTSLVYLDANCNALLDGGDTQITSAINVVADQVVCLVQKVVSPSTATNGSQNISTIGASFVYTAPSAIVANFSQPDTTIIMDSGLVLVKKVREVSSCPSTGADTNLFTTNNQALPNAFIEYQIVYSNPSANVVSNIVINDMTPSFTTFRSASCRTTPSSVLCSVASSPSVGGVGSLQWVLTNNPTGLGSGQSGEVRFCVRVDQ